MSQGPGVDSLRAIEARLRLVVARERLAEAAWGLARFALPAGLLLASATVLLARLGHSPLGLAWLSVLPIPVVFAWAFARPRSLRKTARRVDAHYNLHDRIGNALELAREPDGGDATTQGIIALLIQEAATTAGQVEPRNVVPLRMPGLRPLDGLAALLLLLVSLVPLPGPGGELPPAPGASSDESEAVANTPRAGLDLALANPLRQDLRQLTGEEDVASKTAQGLLDLLEQLEEGEIDRAAAFEQLEAIEKELADSEERFQASLEEDPGILADAMQDLARAMEQHEVMEDLAKALERGDGDAAEEALEKAGEQAESGDDEARRALEKALEDAERSLGKSASKNTDTAKELADAERRLKRQQKRPASDPEEQERRLKKQKRDVERLRRKHEQEKAAQRRLDQLRRKAQQARSRSGGKQGRRQARRQMGEGMRRASNRGRQSRRLGGARDGVEEAKTFIRRAGRQGENESRRRKQHRSFSKAAKGRGKKGKKGESTLLVEGKVGEGEPNGMMEMEGQGQQPGAGQGEGDGQGQGEGQGQGSESQSESTSQAGGDGIGQGAIESLGEDGTTMGGVDYRNVKVEAQHGRGATRAEIIRTSSQEGFAGEAYRDVYKDYRGFAQSALDDEAVPAPKRRNVKRYFQLIQPRN